MHGESRHLDLRTEQQLMALQECNGEFTDGRYFLRGESKDPVCVRCEEKRLKA